MTRRRKDDDEPPLPPVDDDDFAAAMGELHVERLDDSGDRVPVATGPRADEAPPRRPPPLKRAVTQRETPPREAPPDDPELAALLGTVRAVERRAQRTPPARGPVLDLHGYSESDALHELRKFVALQHAAGERTLRIVTGKGGIAPVLRPAAQAWLESSTMVHSVRAGREGEGGEGALVVTLRSREDRRR